MLIEAHRHVHKQCMYICVDLVCAAAAMLLRPVTTPTGVIVMALYNYGPIQSLLYIVMALYSYGPIDGRSRLQQEV